MNLLNYDVMLIQLCMCAGQALQAIKLLKEHDGSLKIQRAQMRLKLSVPGQSL